MATTQLEPKVAQGRPLRQIDIGIYSVLPEGTYGAPYDLRAMALDTAMSSAYYQRLTWGVSVDTIESFANEAFSDDNLPYLEAGCGTMRFTAPVYARVELPLTAVDPSLAMLRRAQEKVAQLKSDAVSRMALVQADIVDLPFADDSYETVLCLDLLHQYLDGGRLIDALTRVIRPGGELYLTSLVSGTRPVGEKAAELLMKNGVIGTWRHPGEVRQLVDSRLNLVSYWTEGNMAFAWAVKPL